MNVPKDRRIELAGKALERLVHCPENTYRKALLCECVTAYLPVDQEQRRQFEDMLLYHPNPAVRAMSVGLLDDVKERGRLEGLRELLRKLLEARFGSLPPTVLIRLQAWPSDRLTECGCALLTAASLDELGLGESAVIDT